MVETATDNITYLFTKIENEIQILKDISESLGLSTKEDQLIQYPANTDKIYLQAGETFEIESQVNKKLTYLSIDAPEGVLVTIDCNNYPFMFMIDEIGAIEFQHGILFETLKVKAVNTAITQQKWSLRMVFS